MRWLDGITDSMDMSLSDPGNLKVIEETGAGTVIGGGGEGGSAADVAHSWLTLT